MEETDRQSEARRVLHPAKKSEREYCNGEGDSEESAIIDMQKVADRRSDEPAKMIRPSTKGLNGSVTSPLM